MQQTIGEKRGLPVLDESFGSNAPILRVAGERQLETTVDGVLSMEAQQDDLPSAHPVLLRLTVAALVAQSRTLQPVPVP